MTPETTFFNNRPRAKQAIIYLVKSIILVQALFIVAKIGPELPPTGLIVVTVAYALLSTVGALHFTVIKRLHRQYKLNATGKLSRLNRKWLATLVGVFILSLVSAFLFVLESPKWDAFEWALTVAAIPVYYVVFRFAQKAAQKEYAARFDRAKAMRVSFWVVGVILCLLYATIGLFGQHAMDSLTLEEALNSIPAPFTDSPSALMADLDKLSCFANGLTAFGLAQVSDTSFLVAFICRFVMYAAVIFGLINLFNSCVLTAQEMKEEFQPLRTNQSGQSSKPILFRYLLALGGTTVIFALLFMAFNAEAEKAQNSEEGTRIEIFVSNTTDRLSLLLDEKKQQWSKYGEMSEQYWQQRRDLIDTSQSELLLLANDYYDSCAKNISGYLDKQDGLFSNFFSWFEDDNTKKRKFKEQITTDVDDSSLIQQYDTLQNQLKDLERSFTSKLQENPSSVPEEEIELYKNQLETISF